MTAKGQLRIRIVGDNEDLDQKLDKAVKGVKVAALAMGTAFAAGLVKTLNIDAANDKLAAQLGLSAAESKRIGGVAGKLYADAYGGSIEEVNTAVGAVVSSIDGMRTASSAAVESMTAKVLDLATAFEVDTARAAQVAGQMITTGLAKDGAQALDLLVAGMQNVPAAVREDLIDAVDEYAPFMQSIGVTGERAMALLVGAAEKGAFGLDKTGDALKEFTIRSTDMSAKSKGAYKALGLSWEDMTRQLLAGGDQGAEAFEKVVTGLQKMTDPAKQAETALALFGTPLEDLNVSEIPKFLDSLTSARGALGDTAGAADRMGQTLNDNAKTNITGFMRKAKMAFVDLIGGKVIPTIEKAVGWLRDKFGPQLDAIAGVIDDILVPAVIALGAAVFAAGIKMAIGWLIGLGPIALIAIAVIALAALIISNWDAIKSFLAMVWDGIKARAQMVWNGIKQVIINPIVAAWHGIEDAFNAVVNFFGDIPRRIGAALSALGEAIVAPFRWAYNQILGIVNDIAGITSGVTGTIGRLPVAVRGSGPGRKAFRADGGPVLAGQPYIVGERGAELFLPSVSGMVLSNADLTALTEAADRDARTTLGMASPAAPAAASGGGTVRVVLDFDGADADLKRLFRRAVKVEGRGSAERFFTS